MAYPKIQIGDDIAHLLLSSELPFLNSWLSSGRDSSLSLLQHLDVRVRRSLERNVATSTVPGGHMPMNAPRHMGSYQSISAPVTERW